MRATRSLSAPALALVAFSLPAATAGQEPAPSPSAAPPADAQALSPSAGTAVAPGPLGEDFHEGRATVRVQQVDVDTVSSKFREYRDVPAGVTLPDVRAFGEKDRFRYDLTAENVRQEDEHYRALLGRDAFRLGLDFRRIPHRFGNRGRTLLQETSQGVLEISDSLQRAFQNALETQFATNRNGINFDFLSALVAPSLAAANVVDLQLERERGRIDLSLAPGHDWDVRLSYFHERRTGDRAAAGTSFGFGNVVETPEPVHYLTQDVSAIASLERRWGSARAGLAYNRFDDRVDYETFDNPFRATDSTDPSAYTGPASGSVNGARLGRVGLPPDNESFRGFGGATVRLPGSTRLTADFTVARWRQNDTAFLPYTTNTAITSPLRASEASTLPASHLDGRIGVVTQSYMLTSRPRGPVSFTARLRSYDLDNQTPRLTFPGYVRFDAAWQAVPRISVPYGFRSQRFDATAAYDFGPASLEAGYRYQAFHRTFRETEKTTEDGASLAATVRISEWSSLRASYERGSRDYDEYDPERSEDASFVQPGPLTNLPALRRYDQAKKDVDRASVLLQLSPGDKVMFSASYRLDRDDYDASAFGLVQARYTAVSADVDYTPAARWTLFAFYSRENGSSFQRGRQSGATPSTNPLDDWTSRITDHTDTAGAGVNLQIVPDRWTLDVSGRYQRVDGFNDLFSPPGGTPDIAMPIGAFDDTRLLTLGSELRYLVRRGWRLGLGAWWEEYRIRDAQTQGVPNYVPGSFFLNAADGDYRGVVGYLGVTRTW
jgi:MtrB/PioB family decaheme-associated outer membrane protein